LQTALDDATDKLSDMAAMGGGGGGAGPTKADSEKVAARRNRLMRVAPGPTRVAGLQVTAVKKQLNDLRAIQREMQAIMNETKDQLTREQTQSAVKDKKLQKCYEMIQANARIAYACFPVL
jgi:hypothetical protein